ncbi:MAG TPA: ribosome small subunit-dependent GTPase A [Casimicrobiaceae bacterium]|nr:ribosome small subunit-dependent GTPase A [Casimicrobiaceae bacterium]
MRVRRIHGGGAIEEILRRDNLVYRSDAFKQKLIAANVTQVIGVVAPDLPSDFELIDRWSVAAEIEGATFLIVANKADLEGSTALVQRLAPWRKLGYRVLPLSATRAVQPLVTEITGRRSVLVGQSGMGKSTMLNGLLPDVAARTREVSAYLRTGRHTTTETTLHLLGPTPSDGWIVDSPGMKAFGLAHVDPRAIEEGFVEIRPLLGQCRFRDCRHDQEPGCAVQAAVECGEVMPHRVALLHAMVAESEAVRAH